MPIAIRVVSAEAYAAWLTEAKKKFAFTNDSPVRVAASGGPAAQRQ
jgi:cytochrome c oxidase subunit II